MQPERSFFEKRSHERLPYDAVVEIEVDGSEKCPARLVNISLGGAFLEVDPAPGFASKLALHIDLPGVAERSRIECVVRWTKEGIGIGVQFEKLRAIEVWGLNKLMRDISSDG